MSQFAKYMFATIAGILISSLLLFLIGIGVLGGMIASDEAPVTLQEHAILVLNLEGELTERSEDSPLDRFFGPSFKKQGLDHILEAIGKARMNPNIAGIYLEAGTLNASIASLQEIREALLLFREAGKTIIAYGDNYSQGLYYLASAANLVILNPVGAIEWKGLSAERLYFKDLLQKMGVEVQVFRVGEFKSAVEPFLRNDMSEENKAQYAELLGSIWQQMVKDISLSRQISINSLNQLAEEGLFFAPSQKFVTTHLVDSLLYRSQVRNHLKRLSQTTSKEAPRLVSVAEMRRVADTEKNKSKNQIAVYYAYGEIDGFTDRNDGIRSTRVIRDLRKLQEDEDVKAVVLRINSPGGSAFGSEQLWKAVADLKKVKPVIVSMGDYAASGGYYMASAASAIVAQPTTLTGSIGIFGMIPCLKGTGEKIGVHTDRITTHPHADLYSASRALSPTETRLMQQMLDRGYDLFLNRCSEGRHIPKAEVHKIAQGHVWSGAAAKELKLVDELGGIPRAVELAVKKARLQTYFLKAYPEEKSFLQSLLEEEPTRIIQSRLLKSIPGADQAGELAETLLNTRYQLQTRAPYCVTIE